MVCAPAATSGRRVRRLPGGRRRAAHAGRHRGRTGRALHTRATRAGTPTYIVYIQPHTHTYTHTNTYYFR